MIFVVLSCGEGGEYDNENYDSSIPGPSGFIKSINYSKSDSLSIGDSVIVYANLKENLSPDNFLYKWYLNYYLLDSLKYHYEVNFLNSESFDFNSHNQVWTKLGGDSLIWIVPSNIFHFNFNVNLRVEKVDSINYFDVEDNRVLDVNRFYTTKIKDITFDTYLDSTTNSTTLYLYAHIENETNLNQINFWKPFILHSKGDTTFSYSEYESFRLDSLTHFYKISGNMIFVMDMPILNQNEKFYTTIISVSDVFNAIPDTLTKEFSFKK